MRLLGFDFDAGRLDVSTHPFSGGVPEDVRMTTRYREDEFLGSLMGTIHETGHGRYEQNLPRELARPAGGRGALDGDPREPVACRSRCSSARTPASCGLLAPLLRRGLRRRSRPSSRDNLHRLLTRVQAAASSASTPTRSPTRRT